MPVQAANVAGHAIQRLRKQAGQTQDELAEKLGVDQGSISKWETGKQEPDLVTIGRIERALGQHRGAILVAAGLVDVPGIEAALFAESRLSGDDRDAVLVLYRALLARRKRSDRKQ